jgi:hypothetical protein
MTERWRPDQTVFDADHRCARSDRRDRLCSERASLSAACVGPGAPSRASCPSWLASWTSAARSGSRRTRYASAARAAAWLRHGTTCPSAAVQMRAALHAAADALICRTLKPHTAGGQRADLHAGARGVHRPRRGPGHRQAAQRDALQEYVARAIERAARTRLVARRTASLRLSLTLPLRWCAARAIPPPRSLP